VLTAIARTRARDMAAKGYFAHTSPSGESAFTLLDQAGIAFRSAAENIARNDYPDASSASVAFNAFLNSAPHRANMLCANCRRVGVGYAAAGRWKYYVVVFTD
jgi:uncharacterized protein YkwD